MDVWLWANVLNRTKRKETYADPSNADVWGVMGAPGFSVPYAIWTLLWVWISWDANTRDRYPLPLKLVYVIIVMNTATVFWLYFLLFRGPSYVGAAQLKHAQAPRARHARRHA